MKWYVIENEQLEYKHIDGTLVIEKGWGNGYVAIPPNHPAYKMDYDTLAFELKVHGGVTWSNFGNGVDAPKTWWVFGFDTSHYNDNLRNWPKERVVKETIRLFWQLLEIEWGGL